MIKPPGPSVSQVVAVTPSSPVERVRGDVGRLLVAVQQTAAQGPEIAVGERVNARLVEPLQGRQWLAVVKNTVITLQWPANAAVPTQGGSLSLQVASLMPRLSFALIEAAPSAPAHGAVAVQLSAAGETLNTLVRAGVPGSLATLEATPVLLADPAATPAERAQAVAQAVVHSGLFYESHLLAWAEGRMQLARLATEPQARLQQALQQEPPIAREAAEAALGGVLQRQLDALDGRPLAFSGLAWPGQPAEWRIQREAPDARGDGATDERGTDGTDPPPAWTTQIQLDLPRLGALGAKVRVTGTQVTLDMTLDSDAGAGLMTTHRERLASALQAAGLSLSSLTVHRAAPSDGHAEEA